MQEVFKSIVGYENLYQISNCGRVKSSKRKGTLGGIMKPQPDTKGYLRIRIHKNNVGSTYKIHRLVAQHFIPNPQNKPQVNHLDRVKTNNNDWNLEWATSKENAIHKHKTLNVKGEKNNFSILTEKEVLEIRSKYIPHKYTLKMLANEYKVSKSAITMIVTNRNWKHL